MFGWVMVFEHRKVVKSSLNKLLFQSDGMFIFETFFYFFPFYNLNQKKYSEKFDFSSKKLYIIMIPLLSVRGLGIVMQYDPALFIFWCTC